MTIDSRALKKFGRRFATRVFFLLLGTAFPAWSQTVTNLSQLDSLLGNAPQLFVQSVRLNATVCAASRPQVGVLILQDESGIELLELGDFGRQIRPGDKVSIRGDYCTLRRRELGVEIIQMPVADNDGIHVRRTWGGRTPLKAGLNPIRVEWFNNLREYNLELSYAIGEGPLQYVSASNFWHTVIDPATGHTNFLSGLQVKGYEGYWERMPDYNLLVPVKTGISTNLDLDFRSRDELVGLRFDGFFSAPKDGDYLFRLRSDDGSLLFFGQPELPVVQIGVTNPPDPVVINFSTSLTNLSARCWVAIEGRASFVVRKGAGLEFELRSDHDAIQIRLPDAVGLDIERLQNARVRVTGIGRGALAANRSVVLGAVFAAGPENIAFLEHNADGQLGLPISSIGAVQNLPLEAARRSLPVKVCGVVTDSRNAIYEKFMSVQDDNRGIFVVVNSFTNPVPGFGQKVEIQGHSGAGDFAPVIIADKITDLGAGRLPEPARLTWTELFNGSMDVQWAEIQGVVTAVRSNTISLLMPEGRMDVIMNSFDQANLQAYLKSVVRIRGVFYAMWNAATREVLVGSVRMRNASVTVEVPAPADPFEAILKTPRELLLFDSQAKPFRRIKVRGQVVYADKTQLFLEDNGAGLRVIPSEVNSSICAGDLVDVVGYPDISRTALVLRDATLRRTGHAVLLAPKDLKESDWMESNLASTRVRVRGQLLGWHLEQGSMVLEMQSGKNLYLARIAPGLAESVPMRTGSRLELTGVYVGRGRSQNAAAESFELLLNSPTDVRLLTQPPWWTLQRLLILIGGLMVVLVFAVVWISQLRRVVDQRTRQLGREILEREKVERQHALEAERSRIARDLHDDLGASLTEISVLANTGQRPKSDGKIQANLFHAIAGKARNLIDALDVIVWAVNPEDNSLQSFADYVTSYAEDFFSHTSLSCRFKVPVTFPHMTLEGRVRHDLLMVVKETLNNIVRHAEAAEVEFRMAVEDQGLSIDITDDGKGFETGGAGHGLKNLPVRLAKLGGSCVVESRVGGGTTVKIRLPLAASPDRPDTTFD